MADKTNPLLQDEHDDVTGLLGSLLKAVGRLPKALPSDDQAQLARGRTVLVAPTNIPELLVNSETYPEEHDFVVSIQTASLPVDNSGGVWGGGVCDRGRAFSREARNAQGEARGGSLSQYFRILWQCAHARRPLRRVINHGTHAGGRAGGGFCARRY